MPERPPHPCGSCGRLVKGRCPCTAQQRAIAQAQAQANKWARRNSARTHRETQRRKAFVNAWIAEYGNVCPGYAIPPHTSFDLTADHIKAVAAGGDEAGALQVLCRSCNSRKRTR